MNQPPKEVDGSELLSRLATGRATLFPSVPVSCRWFALLPSYSSILGLRPRYHFSGMGVHFERSPYRLVSHFVEIVTLAILTLPTGMCRFLLQLSLDILSHSGTTRLWWRSSDTALGSLVWQPSITRKRRSGYTRSLSFRSRKCRGEGVGCVMCIESQSHNTPHGIIGCLSEKT